MSHSKIVAAIELGTSQIKVLIGEIVDGQSLNIIGRGYSPSIGVKKGEIFSYQKVSKALDEAISEAELNAGIKAESVFLAQSGAHLKGRMSIGTAVVARSDGTVSVDDILRARSEAMRSQAPAGRIFIQHINNPFTLDGKEYIDPVGLQGRSLEGRVWSVLADEAIVKQELNLIYGMNFGVDDMIVSSVASAHILLQEGEKESGSVVIDIGAGTTDYAVYRAGRIVRTGVIPVGGDHITNDLSLGLRMSRKNSEQMKLKFGKALVDQNDKHEKAWLVGDLTIGDRTVLKHAIYRIINARVEEIFEIVRSEILDLINQEVLQSGIVLTGGTSRLPKIVECCKRVIDLPTRLGENPYWIKGQLHEPEWSTTIGLLSFALNHENDEPTQRPSRGIMRKIANILTMNR